MAGTLFVVATPIGNLEDLSLRALRTLREADLIAAEDTRHTLKLLTHYEIRKPLVSLREHNEHRETPRLIARLERGETIALVSDAGTPGIADPGAALVRAARRAKLAVVPIPGPSAVTAALSVAGLEGSEFVFLGFAPARGSERTTWLDEVRREARPVVFFEAPHRIVKTTEWLKSNLVERQIDIVREISKINYELVEWSNISDGSEPTSLGEFVVVVHRMPARLVDDQAAIAAFNMFGRMTENNMFEEQIALSAVAWALGLPLESARRAIRAGRKLVKQHNMTGS